MKSYKYLWGEFLSEENIKIAVHDAGIGNKNKRTKKKIRYIEEHIDEYIPKIQHIASNYRNPEHEPKIIYDGITRKKRTIIVPTYYEQIIHHMIVNILKPIFMKPMYQHSYGSIPGRGVHSAAKTIKRWLSETKYILKLDIRKYFDNVSQEILISKLEKIIKDEQFMNLLKTVISATDHGIPLGFYTSQWFANFYLTSLDHYISTDLGFGHYIRYMDDMVIMSNNKRKLRKLKGQIGAYLYYELDLELKSNWQIFSVEDRDLDFMGFRFFPNKTILRKSIFHKAVKKARLISKKKPTAYDACQLLSYIGWFKHTDTYGSFKKYISPYVSISKMKKLVSNRDKRRKELCLIQ